VGRRGAPHRLRHRDRRLRRHRHSRLAISYCAALAATRGEQKSRATNFYSPEINALHDFFVSPPANLSSPLPPPAYFVPQLACGNGWYRPSSRQVWRRGFSRGRAG
jgi:hypothetical protein